MPVIENVLVDWLFVWEPSKKGKFSCCCIFPEGSSQHAQVKAEIEKARVKGISDGKFTEADSKKKAFKGCLRNGTEEVEEEDRPKHYLGQMFFNANNTDQPGIVGPDNRPLLDRDKLYSGCICHVDINFYPFSHPEGGKGVGAGFNNIMLVKEGDRLDGRQSAAEAFANYTTEPEDDLQ